MSWFSGLNLVLPLLICLQRSEVPDERRRLCLPVPPSTTDMLLDLHRLLTLITQPGKQPDCSQTYSSCSTDPVVQEANQSLQLPFSNQSPTVMLWWSPAWRGGTCTLPHVTRMFPSEVNPSVFCDIQHNAQTIITTLAVSSYVLEQFALKWCTYEHCPWTHPPSPGIIFCMQCGAVCWKFN